MITYAIVKNVALMLMLTLTAILVFSLILKHFKKYVPQLPAGLEILGWTSLGGKSRIMLVKAREIEILLGVSDSTIQTLHVFEGARNDKIID